MIHFVTGRPGGGKSYYAARQICTELRVGSRYVVTSLALKLPELADWCHGNCREGVDLGARVRQLSDGEVRNFFLFEPGRDWLGRVPLEGGGSFKGEPVTVPDFRERLKVSPGCLYVIDEAHLFFGARDWQTCGKDVAWFLSQHRKLMCDVIFVTQHPELVDKNFRRWAQDYTVIRNLCVERFFMGIRAPRMSQFRRATYLGVPGGVEKPMETGLFSLDVEGMANIYDTSAGVGLAGRVDTKEKKVGRSPWLLPVLFFVVLVVAMGLPWGCGKLANAGTRALVSSMGGVAGTMAPKAAAAMVGAVAPAAVLPGGPGDGPLSAVEGARRPVEVGGDRLVSVCFMPLLRDGCVWRFASGRVVTPASPGFSGGAGGYVVVDGVRYDWDASVSGGSGSMAPVRRRGLGGF